MRQSWWTAAKFIHVTVFKAPYLRTSIKGGACIHGGACEITTGCGFYIASMSSTLKGSSKKWCFEDSDTNQLHNRIPLWTLYHTCSNVTAGILSARHDHIWLNCAQEIWSNYNMYRSRYITSFDKPIINIIFIIMFYPNAWYSSCDVCML